MTKINDYKEDFKFANNPITQKQLDQVYKEVFFPTLKEIELIEDKKRQFELGIDKIIHFDCNNYITLEEKMRRSAYNDILIERYHIDNNGKKTAGWLYKTRCDILSYSICPNDILETLYLIPFVSLRMAWENNRKEWETKFQIKGANNRTHITYNTPIPINVLTKEIRDLKVWKKNVGLL